MPPKRKRDENRSKTTDSLEIPGYYYDPDKKTYFRLLPEHKCVHPLASKKNISKKPSSTITSSAVSTNPSLPYLNQKQALGSIWPSFYSSNITDIRLKNLKLVHEETEMQNEQSSSSPSKDYCLFLVPWTKHNCLIGVCNDGEKGRCKVRAWTLSAKTDWSENENPNSKITVKPYVEPLWYISGKITDVCMGEMSRDNPCLFICSAQTRARPVTHLVVLPLKTVFLDDYGDSPFRVEVFKFKRNCVWTCCSSSEARCMVAGMENQLVAFNYAGTVTNTIPIPGQNVLGVSCESTGRFLYATTSKGMFHGYDLRCSLKRNSTLTVNLGVPAYQLEPMVTNDVLLISGYKNYLKAFDLRMKKVVINYEHHDNDYMRIKASLDESENVLSSADKNGVVRLWNAKNGKLLNVLPTPEMYDKSDFASTWFRGSTCTPAQVTVTGKHMYIYQSF